MARLGCVDRARARLGEGLARSAARALVSLQTLGVVRRTSVPECWGWKAARAPGSSLERVLIELVKTQQPGQSGGPQVVNARVARQGARSELAVAATATAEPVEDRGKVSTLLRALCFLLLVAMCGLPADPRIGLSSRLRARSDTSSALPFLPSSSLAGRGLWLGFYEAVHTFQDLRGRV
mgnify:CR=1 FL=1